MEFYYLYTYINKLYVGPGWLNEVVGLPNNSYKPITNTAWVGAICKLQKGCTRLAAASDKVYQLLAHGRWFSPASSTTKTGRHDIAESGVKIPKTNQNHQTNYMIYIYTRSENLNYKGKRPSFQLTLI